MPRSRVVRSLIAVAGLATTLLAVAPSSAQAEPVGVPVSLDRSGSIVAWGSNGFGQSDAPALPPGLTYTAVAGGGVHSLGLRSDGTVVGFGLDGDGRTDTPALPAGLTYTAIAAGRWDSLALRSDGTIVGWGLDNAGSTSAPALPSRLRYTAISAGDYHSLALRSNGTVVGFGDDGNGQTDVPDLPDGLWYTAVAAGALHSLALRSDGTVVAWGANTYGERDVPVLPPGLNYTAVAAGGHHSLALRSDGTVIGWGNDTFGHDDVPVLPSGLTYTAIADSDSNALALRSDGTVVGWGSNDSGQGDVPTLATGLRYTAIASGLTNSLAIAAAPAEDMHPVIGGTPRLGAALSAITGPLEVAPSSTDYQWRADGTPVGTNTGTYQPTSSDIGKTITVTITAHRAGYTDVVGTSAPTDAVLPGGDLTRWGVTGLPPYPDVPALPSGLTYTAVSAGGGGTLALRSDGTALGFGPFNDAGQLTVTDLPPGLTYTAVSAGSDHGLGLRSDGSVVAWGADDLEQGDVLALPADVTYTAVSAGDRYSLALRSDGTIVGWGNPSGGVTTAPALPAGLTYVAVAAGEHNAAALRSDGEVVAWGHAGGGRTSVPALPAGSVYTAVNVNGPVLGAVRSDGGVVAWGGAAAAPSLPAGLSYTALALGRYHSAALRSDHTIVTWGVNFYGGLDVPASLAGKTIAGIATGDPEGYAISARFTADHDPVIGGVPRVSEALTAVAGRYSLRPTGGLDYQWRSGGAPVGTDSSIYRPTRADVDKTITVTITAHHDGYDDVVGTSSPTAPVVAGGQLTGWGRSDDGEASAPFQPPGLSFTSVSAGALFSVALRSDGSAIGWGSNYLGRATVPALPSGLTYTAVAAGSFHALALRSDGNVVAWGTDSSGQTDVPALPPGTTYTAISAGINHSLALRSDGVVVAWGDDTYGESDIAPPPDGNPYVGIAAGGYESLALRSDGTVVGWGQDDDGSVTEVPPLPDGVVYTAVTAGDTHSMALRSDGEIATWGFGGSGQNDVPTLPRGVTYTAVAANAIGDYSLAIRSDGTAIGWGGFTDDVSGVPTGLLSGRTVTALAAGSSHALALTADLVADAAPAVSGVARVGETLTVTPPTYNATPDAITYIWAVNGLPTGSTGTTYALTPSDVGKRVSVRVRADKAGYGTAVDFSAQTAPVATRDFVVAARPTITGTPQVGARLTASPGTMAPTPDGVRYEWYADDVQIASATGSTYDLTPAETGKRIQVRVIASRPGYADAYVFSEPVGPVTGADWATNPTASISGIARVGETLTADAGAPQPTPDSIAYAWFADGVATGATGPTYVPTDDVIGAEITVVVTATRAGYDPARSTSAPVGPVVTDRTPTVQLTASRHSLRLGKAIKLTWAGTDATTLVADGAWHGTKPAAGRKWVRPAHLGRNVYWLTATNENGTATAKVVIRVRRPR